MSRPVRHLAHRFFEVLSARPLDSHELAEAAARVGPELWPLFLTQQTADQRHAYQAGSKMSIGSHEPELVLAAMMHDVGKAESGLGVIGRTTATLLMALGLPMPARLGRYRDHGPIGAAKLEDAGAPTIVVLFARHHQGERPAGITPEDWDSLIRADEPGMPGNGRSQ
jgi:hypothetical protein